jgi:hypothetical protein
MQFETLQEWTREEIASVEPALPKDLQQAIHLIHLSLKETANPSENPDDSAPLSALIQSTTPSGNGDESYPTIELYLRHIWEATHKDEQDFRDEVISSFLYELGNFLGWENNEAS